ncbi:hypothetical protein GOV14_01045 [Candidatus Pacearchaeota archaeon]|nr:hypothetical protein [Candidatus Pacearchaeota archaeon]
MENNEFNKILIVYSEKQTETHKKTIEDTKKYLTSLEKDFKTIAFNELHDDHFQDIDLVVTIGGDGTFIRTTHFMRGDTPILGINSEPEFSEGALTSIKNDQVHELGNFLTGNYKVLKRPRARVLHNGKIIQELALNEVYVGTKDQFHTSRYILEHNGKEEEHRSSGALVVTGSGSSAWYKSAGGTPFPAHEKKLKLLVREPFQSRIFNPEMIESEIEEGKKIKFTSKRSYGGVVAIDSYATYDFNNGDIIEIRISSQPLCVIIRNGDKDENIEITQNNTKNEDE